MSLRIEGGGDCPKRIQLTPAETIKKILYLKIFMIIDDWAMNKSNINYLIIMYI